MTDKKNEANETQPADSPAEQILAIGKTAVETAQEAVAKAQEAIEKLQQEGSRILQSVVSETQKMAGSKVEEMRGRVEEMRGKMEEARDRATETFDNLEQIFEERVSRALGRLGIPTKDDFQAIARRLEELNDSVQTLIKSRAQRASAGAEEKDDLKEITGLGPVLEGKLNAEGIHTYRQLVLLTPEEISRIEHEVLHSSGRMQRDNWIEQAKELHRKKYGERL